MKTVDCKKYIGLMSGTSMDGIDTVIAEFNPLKLIATHYTPIPNSLKTEILHLCRPGNDKIHRMGNIDTRLGILFAESCKNILQKSGVSTDEIVAIGSHGQTIRHIPNEKHAFTMQIGDPNRIAALTGITTVADFRRRDMALGGQGAPLTPAFHHHFFSTKTEHRWIVNIGGIANITLLSPQQNQPAVGFDTGPGNTLLDAWCQLHLNKPFDAKGDWAASGKIDQPLLGKLLADPYFHQAPPKSTGREYFNLSWLKKQLQGKERPADIQATLLELTARTILESMKISLDYKNIVLICGGGARNKALMNRLHQLCAPAEVTDTARFGIHPDWIEATCFAWFAHQTLQRQPINLTTVTGSKHATILGGVYFA